MKKKVLIIVAAVLAVLVAAVVGLSVFNRSGVRVNASYETAASNLEKAGYTVEVTTDAEALAAYDVQGLQAVVTAWQGGDRLESPNEDAMKGYNTATLYYFAEKAQADAYYLTDGFQHGYQAWSDAYYHIGVRAYQYNHSENVAYAGTTEALKLCR